MKHFLAITAATIGLFSVSGALAQTSQDDGVSVSVSYADLDLSTAAGRAALDGRVVAAIDRVCPRQDARVLALRHYELACRANAKAGALRQLTAIYAHQNLAQATVQIGPAQR